MKSKFVRSYWRNGNLVIEISSDAFKTVRTKYEAAREIKKVLSMYLMMKTFVKIAAFCAYTALVIVLTYLVLRWCS